MLLLLLAADAELSPAAVLSLAGWGTGAAATEVAAAAASVVDTATGLSPPHCRPRPAVATPNLGASEKSFRPAGRQCVWGVGGGGGGGGRGGGHQPSGGWPCSDKCSFCQCHGSHSLRNPPTCSEVAIQVYQRLQVVPLFPLCLTQVAPDLYRRMVAPLACSARRLKCRCRCISWSRVADGGAGRFRGAQLLQRFQDIPMNAGCNEKGGCVHAAFCQRKARRRWDGPGVMEEALAAEPTTMVCGMGARHGVAAPGVLQFAARLGRRGGRLVLESW